MRALLEVPDQLDIREGDYERLRFHPLMHEIAKRQFQTLFTEEQRTEAKRVVATYYAHYVGQNALSEKTLSYDKENIEGMLQWAHENNQEDVVVSITRGMQYMWNERGVNTGQLEVLKYSTQVVNRDAKTALANTSATVKDEYKKVIDNGLGYARGLLSAGKVEDARIHLKELLDAFYQVHDAQKEAEVYIVLGQVEQRCGAFVAAKKYYMDGMDILRGKRENRNRYLEAMIQRLRGEIALQTGLLDDAKTYYEQSISRLRDSQALECLKEKIHSLLHLGEVALLQKDFRTTERYCNDALSISRSIGDKPLEGWTLGHIGYLAYKRNRPDVARRHYEKARILINTVTNHHCECWLLGNLGHVTHMSNSADVKILELARQRLQEGLQKAQQTNNKREEGHIKIYLARVEEALGNIGRAKYGEDEERMGEAEQYYEGATQLLKDIDRIYYAEAALAYAKFLAKQDTKKACEVVKNAVNAYAQMKLPELKEARDLQTQLKCN